MTQLAAHTVYLAGRQLLRLWRQPAFVALTLLQPLFWMLLFGQVFAAIAELPAFAGDTYATFLAPGIVVMSALFAGMWNGMSSIDAIDRGIMNRFLITPANRAALLLGPMAQIAVVTVINGTVILGIAWWQGAQFGSGPIGLLVLIVCAVLVGTGLGALSHAAALIVRREESLIGVINLLALPLSFLSPIFMQRDLMPEWVQRVVVFNPVSWAVDAGREALAIDPSWGFVGIRVAALMVIVIVAAAIATQAFRAYQRSV